MSNEIAELKSDVSLHIRTIYELEKEIRSLRKDLAEMEGYARGWQESFEKLVQAKGGE